MKNKSIHAFFVLIGIWCTTNGYGQTSYQQYPSAFTSNTLQASILRNDEPFAKHQPELHLNSYRKNSGNQLRNTGRALTISGLALTTLSAVFFLTSYEITYRRSDLPGQQSPTPKTRAKNSMILTGLAVGSTMTVAGTVVWIIGKQQLKKNPGE